MKIICIGRNYLEHAKELNNPVPKEPVIFMKPDTAMLKDGEDFYIPEHIPGEIHHELEIVLKISKAGKKIPEHFADKFYSEIGLGIDFTARDLQSELKTKGLPWERAKAFDGSAPVGNFIKLDQIKENEIQFELKKNGQTVQSGNTKDLIFSFDQLIAYISKYFTLKTGDLIFTGTPAGVGPVKIGDRLEGFMNGEKMLDIKIR